MKYKCEIEYPDDCGENWMNKDNLQLCINSYCENKDWRIKVHNLSSEANERIAYLEKAYADLYRDTTALMGEDKERIKVLEDALRKIKIYCNDRHRVMMLGVQGFNTISEIAKEALEVNRE
jgi:hypothetical protein